MHQLRTILRPLILVVLGGWLGIAAPPAAAQQTVTLSGRVTDSAGQAVPGAFVSLERLPGWLLVPTDRKWTGTAIITSPYRPELIS